RERSRSWQAAAKLGSGARSHRSCLAGSSETSGRGSGQSPPTAGRRGRPGDARSPTAPGCERPGKSRRRSLPHTGAVRGSRSNQVSENLDSSNVMGAAVVPALLNNRKKPKCVRSPLSPVLGGEVGGGLMKTKEGISFG